MGYACPVCEVPQRDGEHLANHLAFTAMLREDEHEAWLDEHVPGWGGETPAELAGRVTDHAEEAEYDEVFEDTTGGGHGHDRGSAPDFDQGAPGTQGDPGGRGPASSGGFEGMAQGVADEAVESVLRDAQELTEEMYGLEEDDDGGEETDGEADATRDEDAVEGNDS